MAIPVPQIARVISRAWSLERVATAVSAMGAPDRAHPDGVLWVRTREPGACQPRRRVLREEGEFQIALLARDVPDATERRKARLREIARTSEAFGPILVWVTSLIELGEPDIANGVLVNHAGFTEDYTYRDALPDQGGLTGARRTGSTSRTTSPIWIPGSPFGAGSTSTGRSGRSTGARPTTTTRTGSSSLGPRTALPPPARSAAVPLLSSAHPHAHAASAPMRPAAPRSPASSPSRCPWCRSRQQASHREAGRQRTGSGRDHGLRRKSWVNAAEGAGAFGASSECGEALR